MGCKGSKAASAAPAVVVEVCFRHVPPESASGLTRVGTAAYESEIAQSTYKDVQHRLLHTDLD